MFACIFSIAVQDTFVEIHLVFKSGGVFGYGLGVPNHITSWTGWWRYSINRMKILTYPRSTTQYLGSSSGVEWR